MNTGGHRPTPRAAAGNTYPSSGAGATPHSPLEERLRERIAASGPLDFAEYMAACLYDEEAGYYSDPERSRVGRSGDFVTNVSIGETFGRLLAHRLHRLWTANGSPRQFHVLELGPEDGSLALDILREARNIDPAFHHALRYHACEHGARKRSALRERFAETGEPRLEVVGAPGECRGAFGAVLANEVLDALPVRLLRFKDGGWLERRVGSRDGTLGWNDGPIADPELAQLARHLGSGYPEGYQTEVCLGLSDFFEELAGCFDRGLITFFDYGHLQRDYYHPDRTEGTLRTYNRHRAGDAPLLLPGEQDLTAHVDFTRTAAAAHTAGFEAVAFGRQEPFLITLATPLLEASSSPAFVRQLRSLTHPAFLGASFHVLEFRKGAIDPGLTLPASLTDLERLK